MVRFSCWMRLPSSFANKPEKIRSLPCLLGLARQTRTVQIWENETFMIIFAAQAPCLQPSRKQIVSNSWSSDAFPREVKRLRKAFPPCSFLNGACLKCGAVMLSPAFFTSYKAITRLPSTPRILPISASEIAVANAASDEGSTMSFTRCFTLFIATALYLSSLSAVVSKSCSNNNNNNNVKQGPQKKKLKAWRPRL